MMRRSFVSAVVLSGVLISSVAQGQELDASLRRYEFVLASSYDLRTVATAGPTLHRMTQDLYLYGLRPQLSSGVDAVLGTAWSMFFTYATMLWPHEFGHWSRASQVDSRFVFHNVNPLLPRTTVEMPDDAPPADQALLSVGGFEVNGLVARQAQLDFYRHGVAFSDELAHASLNKLFFPIYATLFPAHATEPDTWVHTRGDPVHFVLPVYERHTGRPAITAEGTVDPELSRIYTQSVLLSLFWSVLDPGLVQQVVANTDRGFDSRKAWMPVRTENFGWTWGTLFNPSPLGYELYLLNYLLVQERIVEFSVKHGRPMKNRGLRLSAPNLLETQGMRLGAELEGWDQDVYGRGLALSAEAEARVSERFAVVGWLGYKSDGYVMGRGIEETFFGALGLSYSFEHGRRSR